MSTTSCKTWMPSRCQVNKQSYYWHIENFSQESFKFYRQSDGPQGTMYGVRGIRSPEFKMSLTYSKDLRITDRELNLWLTQDTTKSKNRICTSMSPWLKLSLHNASEIPLKCDDSDHFSDSIHICIAWICGRQKERMCKLTGAWAQKFCDVLVL